MTIQVVIADDHQLVREGFKRVIELASDIHVVGEFSSGDELLRQAVNLDCDVLLLDNSMPGLSGIELIHQLRALRPQVQILMVSMHNDAQVVRRALQAGATGYIDKSSLTDMLINAIRTVATGVRFIDPCLLDALISETSQTKEPLHRHLTKRELDILVLIANGHAGGAIAKLFHLSPKTVSSHKTKIMEKLKVTSTAALIQYAIAHNLLGGQENSYPAMGKF